MTRADQKWEDVWFVQVAESLKIGRQRFLDRFGYASNSKTVDAAIVALLAAAHDRRHDSRIDESTIAIPVELVLALTLREGFGRGKGRLKKPSMRKRRVFLAVRRAESLRTRYLAGGMRKGEAREKAIQEAAESEGVERSILRDQMGRLRK